MAVDLRAEPGRTGISRTLPEMFRDRVRTSGDDVALREKHLGVWRSYTWNEYYDKARAFGLGLCALGLQPGDRVAIHSEDRPEWLFSELGVVCVGGTSVGIYPTNPAAEVEYILSHSEARFLVAEDQEQVDKALEVADRCPALERIIVIDPRGLRGYEDPRLMRWEDVEQAGRRAHGDEPGRFERLVDERTPDEIAMIVYTSGTTGPPKGAMLSEANVSAAIRISTSIWRGRPTDRILSYLPLCHVAEKIFSIWIPMASGASANFAESIETVMDNIQEVEPTIFLGVPRIWEKLAAGIQIRMHDASRLKRANFRLWERVGRRLGEVYLRRGRYPFPWNLVYLAGWLLLYRSLQRKLGLSKCHTAVSGAAPIAPEILRFFHGIGIHIREGWGQTESCGIGTITMPEDYRLGTVGVPLEEVELRIDPQTGEILLRGPFVFAGYFRNPEATGSTIDRDGWLHTGDVGYVDDEGHLHITDRMKDIIITAGGKNISPSEIENKLKTSPYIREAVVVGDKRKFLSALIGIESDTVGDWATRRGIAYTTYRDLTEKPEVVELVEEEVRRVNRSFAQVEQIKKFRLLPKELDHEDGELTATQKVKRRTMEERFGDLVESMYR